jgi:GNAT superfamily N-acetyltransferase
MSITLRAAGPSDASIVLRFIEGLAEYEKLSHACIATEAGLIETLFGPRPCAEVILAFWNDSPAGFALFFHNYSTFLAKPGIYLEDLFVDPGFRGKGLGKALLKELARLAVERNCGRVEWAVLDWNEPSINFYKGLGAVPLDDWTLFRVTGDALTNLAST